MIPRSSLSTGFGCASASIATVPLRVFPQGCYLRRYMLGVIPVARLKLVAKWEELA